MREKDQIAKCESELYALSRTEGLVQLLLAILIRYLLKICPVALQLLQPVPVETVGTSLGRCQWTRLVASRFEWLYVGLRSEECEAWLSGVCWTVPDGRRLSDVSRRLYASCVQHGRFRAT